MKGSDDGKVEELKLKFIQFNIYPRVQNTISTFSGLLTPGIHLQFIKKFTTPH